MPYFQHSPTTRINYEVHGSGPPVVFLHGFGASLETWREIEDRVASRCQAYFLDLKGFGRSDKPIDEHYTISDQARIVADFIVRQQLMGVTLVGHSYGGAVALVTYLFLLDDSVEHLPSSMVLIDSAANDRPLPLFVAVLRVPVLNTLLLELVPARLRARLVLWSIYHNRRLVTRERVWRHAQFFDLPGAHHSFRHVARLITASEAATFRSRLAEITAPTLIIWGRNDGALPVANAEYFREGIRGSRLELLDDCGHIPQEERAEACAALTLDFLGRVTTV